MLNSEHWRENKKMNDILLNFTLFWPMTLLISAWTSIILPLPSNLILSLNLIGLLHFSQSQWHMLKMIGSLACQSWTLLLAVIHQLQVILECDHPGSYTPFNSTAYFSLTCPHKYFHFVRRSAIIRIDYIHSFH